MDTGVLPIILLSAVSAILGTGAIYLSYTAVSPFRNALDLFYFAYIYNPSESWKVTGVVEPIHNTLTTPLSEENAVIYTHERLRKELSTWGIPTETTQEKSTVAIPFYVRVGTERIRVDPRSDTKQPSKHEQSLIKHHSTEEIGVMINDLEIAESKHLETTITPNGDTIEYLQQIADNDVVRLPANRNNTYIESYVPVGGTVRVIGTEAISDDGFNRYIKNGTKKERFIITTDHPITVVLSLLGKSTTRFFFSILLAFLSATLLTGSILI